MRRLLLSILASVGVLLGAASTGAAAPGVTSPDTATGWYLALGDSLAAGYQPTTGADLRGGYVGHVLDAVQEAAPKTQLRNLACPGATSETMVEGGGACTYEEGSQLAQAVTFLKAHRGTTRLVTVDVGANDVQRCVARTPAVSVDYACVGQGLAQVGENLPMILGQLRAAAGPDVEIVVGNYYNPFLAVWVLGLQDPAKQAQYQQLAEASTLLLYLLNATIAQAASASGAEVADVATRFQSGDWTLTSSPYGSIPTNVARICEWTWMCSRFDIHANEAGYAVMGEVFAARIG